MAELVVVADDLTGAADTGAQFARGGRRVLVRFAPGALPVADVAVLSTNSRYLNKKAAAAAVRAAVEELSRAAAPRWIYKKVDSTLRGHPAAELDAVSQTWPSEPVLVAPAFPAQGRTVRNGRLWVGGVALEESEFGVEAGSGDLRAVFGDAEYMGLEALRGDEGALRRLLRARGRVVADAETEEDLARLARVAVEEGFRVFCGSAGLALALEDRLNLPASKPVGLCSGAGPLLVVVGSRSAVSTAQVKALAVPPVLLAAATESKKAAEVLADTLSYRAAVLQSGGGDWPQGAAAVAAALGQTVARTAAIRRPGALVLTGGDTALAVCRALGASSLWLDGEVERGLPRGRLADGPYAGLPVVTKAGGFGGEAALRQALRSLDAAGESGS